VPAASFECSPAVLAAGSIINLRGMIVDSVRFQDGRVMKSGRLSLADVASARKESDFVALELSAPSDSEMQELRREFGLHELAVEDARHAHQRPKIEEYGESLFVVLRTVAYDTDREQIALGEVHAFVGADYVIVVRLGADGHGLSEVLERAKMREELPEIGPAAVLYAVTDEVVDGYVPAIDELETDIGEVELEVFAAGRRETTLRVYNLTRQVLELLRATGPLELPLDRLQRGDFPQIGDDARHYFRDIYDHVRRANDRVEGFRHLLTAVLDANVSLVSIRQNDIVRKISGWAAIIAVPTLITGVYGMNFENMPELDWTFGYPFALLLMLALASGLYALLRRVDWL
jgi:magnesium transporter